MLYSPFAASWRVFVAVCTARDFPKNKTGETRAKRALWVGAKFRNQGGKLYAKDEEDGEEEEEEEEEEFLL